MIKTWKLKNFKSVSREIDLDFKPLTIFAGANSSGKSTIIQSILLTAQTIQNPVYSKSVVLNGHISKFGTYSDIVSKSNSDLIISIGFSLEPKYNPNDILMRRYYPPFDENITELDCKFSFYSKKDDDIEQLQPRLVDLEINSNREDVKSYGKIKIHIKKSQKSIEQRIAEYKIKTISKIEENSLEYEVDISARDQRRFGYYRMPLNLKHVGANLFHFMPYRLTGVYNSIENQIQSLLSSLTGQINNVDFDIIENEEIIFNQEIKELIIQTFKKINFEQNQIAPNLSIVHRKQIEEKINKLISEFNKDNLEICLKNRFIQRAAVQLFEENRTEFNRIYKKINKDDFIVAQTYPIHFPEVEYIDVTFKKNLKYLGPLRDNPKSVYPLEGYADPTDIGYRGENTAAVLDIHKNVEIPYIPSSEFENKNENKNEITVTLKTAVMDWLNYLGVATNVNTADKGKLGHELTVSTDDSSILHDLTHVGVGVSQVLPILVLSLLSGSDSTLIFEQPELHLHPKVQTRLADFFLSMNLLKKQCIVETHSEYLINRLRYLVAISKGDEIAKSTIMYFVEKENSESIYKPIVINKYGVIENWPKGFFDESEEIATAMLKASMEKRRNERS